jgi:hypothetical protein
LRIWNEKDSASQASWKVVSLRWSMGPRGSLKVEGDLQDVRLVILIGCNTLATCAEKRVMSGVYTKLNLNLKPEVFCRINTVISQGLLTVGCYATLARDFLYKLQEMLNTSYYREQIGSPYFQFDCLLKSGNGVV